MPALADVYPLLEILHAVRDNLKIDLRERCARLLCALADLSHRGQLSRPRTGRPKTNSASRCIWATRQPDLNRAALARAAGLSMVAYDNNGLDNQFLQGWLIQDRFLMMTPFGAPYEFLWANPYQPGLSYYQLPLVFHDPNSGALFVRSGWDEDADWFGLYGGRSRAVSRRARRP